MFLNALFQYLSMLAFLCRWKISYTKASEVHQDGNVREEHSPTGPGQKKKYEKKKKRWSCEVVLVWTVYEMANCREPGRIISTWYRNEVLLAHTCAMAWFDIVNVHFDVLFSVFSTMLGSTVDTCSCVGLRRLGRISHFLFAPCCTMSVPLQVLDSTFNPTSEKSHPYARSCPRTPYWYGVRC